MSMRSSRAWLATIAAAASVLGGLALASAPAAAGAAGLGYVRLAHLSPDTPPVDVYLSSPSGAIEERVFKAVPYGGVSDYLPLAAGVYEVAMRKQDAPADSPPVLTTSVTVVDKQAYTVAGVDRFADLGLRVIEDDLTLPADDKAKVRVVQASVRAPVLAVSVADGPTIADRVAFATTTDYQQVDPGRWRLVVRPAGGGPETGLEASLGAGNVYSLLVLDDGASGLTAKLLTDASRQGGVPLGGVETGAGGSLTSDPDPAMVLAAGLVLLTAALAAVIVVRRTARPRVGA
ncbi:MAG TPA: DUF4397 domain-containing protein [Micromonosporaceae bacterium]|jgi:hypothetical protein|nr:DUF4397 domain-containing protein [Micromonosporaceae bacterium]